MDKIFTQLNVGQELLAQNELPLPDGGKIITEIVKNQDGGIIVGHIYFEKDSNDVTIQQWCGYCGGQLVGCVNCSNPFLNCANRTITCY